MKKVSMQLMEMGNGIILLVTGNVDEEKNG